MTTPGGPGEGEGAPRGLGHLTPYDSHPRESWPGLTSPPLLLLHESLLVLLSPLIFCLKETSSLQGKQPMKTEC